MDIFSLLDELQTIARNGLNFSQDAYERERYERLLQLAAQNYAELLAAPDGEIRRRFLDELGYITPKVGTDAAIFNNRGEILLVDRADGSGWCLPCGWVEPNESPAEGILREVREETGLEVRIERLVGVFTRKPDARMGPHTTISIVHLCEVTGGALSVSHESRAVRYWDIDAMSNWHATHETLARAAYRMWRAGEGIKAVSA